MQVPQTQDMLDQLQEYHPSTAHGFHLKGTSISQASLRLLCERPKQDVRRIESYIALSYCWHGPDWETVESLGQPEMGWPISTAMVHALLRQRGPNEGIWIDQFCINQNDKLDQQLAIGSMDLFYKSARKAVVVLEDVCVSEAETVAVEHFLANSRAFLADPRPQNPNLDVLARILIRILSARWFRRAWCSHELQLSRDLVILVPTNDKPVKLSLEEVESWYSETSDYVRLHKDLTDLMEDDIYMSYDFVTRTLMRDTKEQPGRSLISEFSDIHRLACSSQTDLLCIAMNISGLQVYFTGQIRSANECRWVLAMVALSAGDATVLGGVDEILMAEDHDGIPSWLNWTNDLEETMTTVGASKLRNPACITSINQHEITLDLLDFTGCLLNAPSKKILNWANHVLGLLSKIYANDSPVDQPFWIRSDLGFIESFRERYFVTEILACSFECGPDWMMEQMPCMPNLAAKIQGLLGTFESRFWPIMKDSIDIEGFPGMSYFDKLDDKRKSSLLQYLYFIIFDSPLGPGNEWRLLKSPASLDVENRRMVRCLSLDMGAGNKALLALPTESKPGMLGMPVALSNGSCATVRRLWLMSSCDGSEDSAWRLATKFFMFTLMPIEESATVVKMSNQVIRQFV